MKTPLQNSYAGIHDDNYGGMAGTIIRDAWGSGLLDENETRAGTRLGWTPLLEDD